MAMVLGRRSKNKHLGVVLVVAVVGGGGCCCCFGGMGVGVGGRAEGVVLNICASPTSSFFLVFLFIQCTCL